jgi:hypothetical protein
VRAVAEHFSARKDYIAAGSMVPEKSRMLNRHIPSIQKKRGPRKKPQGYADSALRYRRHKGDRGKSRRATRTPPCATGDTKEPAEKAAGLRGLRPALQETQRSPRKKPQGCADSALRYRRDKGARGKAPRPLHKANSKDKGVGWAQHAAPLQGWQKKGGSAHGWSVLSHRSW